MKPGSRDRAYPILITGRELEELNRFTWAMAEAFGLDERIEKYQGQRPIGLYPWDLDCLGSVTEEALADDEEYPTRSGPGDEAMKRLRGRLLRLRDRAYGETDE